jgi:hypothetical protein
MTGELFQIVGDLRDLGRGIAGGAGDLLGQPRQAQMQALTAS